MATVTTRSAGNDTRMDCEALNKGNTIMKSSSSLQDGREEQKMKKKAESSNDDVKWLNYCLSLQDVAEGQMVSIEKETLCDNAERLIDSSSWKDEQEEQKKMKKSVESSSDDTDWLDDYSSLQDDAESRKAGNEEETLCDVAERLVVGLPLQDEPEDWMRATVDKSALER